MKKRTLWIIIILVVVFVAVQIISLAMVYYNHIWKYSADFEAYTDDFSLIKSHMVSEYSGETDKWLSISSSGQSGLKVYDPDSNEYIDIPSDVLLALTSIRNGAFPDKDATFNGIRIQNNRIAFCIESGQYALVYAPDEKPSWVNGPEENVAVRVRSIGDGWYHVTKKS